MENLSFQLAKIVGAPNHNNWPQVYTFSPEDEEKKRQRGVFWAAFSLETVKTGEESEIAALGKEIILRLHEEYYGQTGGSPLTALKQAVQKVTEEFIAQEQRLEITTAAFLDHTLYLALVGSGEIWFKRKEALGRLLKGSSGEIQSASGFLQEGDWLVLGTGSFFTLLTEGVLRAAMEGEGPDEVVESLSPLIHSQESASSAAALIIRFKKEEIALSEELVETEELKEEAPPKEIPPQTSKNFIGGFIASVRGRIPKFSLGTIYVHRSQGEGRRKKMFLAVAVILISLLAISLFLGAKKRQESERQEQFFRLSEEIVKILEQGEALAVLNPNQSKQLLLEAQAKLSEAEKLRVEPVKTEQLKTKLSVALGRVFKEYRLGEVPLLTDLTLITEGGRGDKFSLAASILAVLDQQKNRVLLFDFKEKSGEILVGGGTINAAKLLVASQDEVYILEEKGVALVQRKSKKTEREKIALDPQWGEIADMGFFGDNLYLLDKGKNQIWRYGAAEEGFGSRQAWFTQGGADLSQVNAMAIDGSIWLLAQNGKMLKFTQGAPVGLSLAGLAKSLSSPALIRTNEESQFVYVLDKGNRRILVFSKSGEYQSEYLWEGISEVTDMVVLEAERKIFLLAGSKIYEIDLR